MERFAKKTYRTYARPVYRTAKKVVNQAAKTTAQMDPTGLAPAIINTYERQLRKQRATTARRSAYARSQPQPTRHMESAPVTVGMTIKRPPVKVQEGSADSKTVSACEVIFPSVTSTDNSFSGGNQTQEMLLNPLHPALKILADEAKNFQMYRFTKAKLVFESTCNSTITGAVGLGQLSDVLDYSPSDYESFALLKDTIQANVWQSVELPLKLSPDFYYVSYGPNAVGSAEIRQVNQAKLFFSLINLATSSGAVGNIKLEYSVELVKRINGDPLNIFDAFGYQISPSAPLSALTDLTGSRRSPWLVRDGAKLIMAPRATYIVNFTLAIDGDTDAIAPAYACQVRTPSGSYVSWLSVYGYSGYTDKTFTNQNLYTQIAKIKTTVPNCYLDFQPIIDAAITHNIDINITVDIVN